ncbi:MAG: preprotein translocase subunit SecA [Deltaproteobacteria bacterium]|jgi:preprotein translocase subunit SecA|nr:preprotein translocase subunit SecA [Deltaproteobacteria bacterium]
MLQFFKFIFGSANQRQINRLAVKVDAICALEPKFRQLSDQDLANKTPEFKERLKNGESLDSLVIDAFAVTREAAKRVLGQRHFDEQLMGGLVLHEGKIAEMKTGEGKTLAATLPCYVNGLSGNGVHVVTVNDYLAQRDADWMGQIYKFLGLQVGTIIHGLTDAERREAYGADITYGTNHEFGFDYLRDNMKFRAIDYVQRGFNYAIVDEVDSILIDEARTPLIISGPAEKSTKLYIEVDRVIPRLRQGEDYLVDEKLKSVTLTESGVTKTETSLNVKNLYDPSNIEILHHVNQSLKAHVLFKKDKDYMVKNGQVVIVDSFTGRAMEGRRFGDGLHQALEAKERVAVQSENQTLASITYQNYFRMYQKLAGMTGTADTEAVEFDKIYGLHVVILPTHRKMIRKDYPDIIFGTIEDKYNAVVDNIEILFKSGQPVLVGTISIDNSEKVSKLLKKRGIPHEVLNAKHHAREASIVARAGQKNSVTISTNMAGRGTDIVLGPEVQELGGLFIIGTERHESRRIDNQLRGRSGRQGDPGESLFYLSLEDDLMRIFGGDRFKNFMTRLGMGSNQPIASPLLSKSIENAQKNVESHHFDARKHLLEYDDVMNRQREIIYQRRRKILFDDNIMEYVLTLIDEESQAFVIEHHEVLEDENSSTAQLENNCLRRFGFVPDMPELLKLEGDARIDYFYDQGVKALQEHLQTFPEGSQDSILRFLVLRTLDTRWKDHLLNMDRLKEGIGLRGYAQRDPLREYQREGFELFRDLIDSCRTLTLSLINHMKVNKDNQGSLSFAPPPQQIKYNRKPDDNGIDSNSTAQTEPGAVVLIGRNSLCPCGSGKKYKHCCGRKR